MDTHKLDMTVSTSRQINTMIELMSRSTHLTAMFVYCGVVPLWHVFNYVGPYI